MPPQDRLNDFNDLNTILRSPIIRRILQKHKDYLQGEVNRCIEAQNLITAYGFVSRLKDIDKMMGMFETELDKLREEK